MIQVTFMKFVCARDWISVRQKYWFEGYDLNLQGGIISREEITTGIIYACTKFLEGKQIIAAEKMR